MLMKNQYSELLIKKMNLGAYNEVDLMFMLASMKLYFLEIDAKNQLK